jgi:hypothetical protein
VLEAREQRHHAAAHSPDARAPVREMPREHARHGLVGADETAFGPRAEKRADAGEETSDAERARTTIRVAVEVRHVEGGSLAAQHAGDARADDVGRRLQYGGVESGPEVAGAPRRAPRALAAPKLVDRCVGRLVEWRGIGHPVALVLNEVGPGVRRTRARDERRVLVAIARDQTRR